MAMPAKSAELHRLHGTTPGTKQDAGASRLVAGRPKFPRDLTPAARVEFKRIVQLLEKRRQITEGDVETIRLYVIANERYKAANAKLAEEGLVVIYTRVSNGETFRVEKKNLHLEVAAQAERTMLAVLKELGLTPRAKDAVRQTSPDPEVQSVVPGSMADLYGFDLAGLRVIEKPQAPIAAPMTLEEADGNS
jgi:P27 family predicted phage terminase small subunit